jgi:hypothetical protein
MFDNPKGVPKVTSDTEGEEITPDNPETVQQFPVDDTDEAHEAAEVEVPETEVEDKPAKLSKADKAALKKEKKAAKEAKEEEPLTADAIRAQRTIGTS